jgi:hypothetical protein
MASLPGRRVSKASQTGQVSAHWMKVNNPAAVAVSREAEEDWEVMGEGVAASRHPRRQCEGLDEKRRGAAFLARPSTQR